MKTFSLLLPQVRFMKTFSFRLPILKTFTLRKTCCRKAKLWKRFHLRCCLKFDLWKRFHFRCCCSLFYENVFISLLQIQFMKTFSSRNIYVNTYIHKYVNTYIHTGHIFLRREYSRKSGKILSKVGKSRRKCKKVGE